MTGPGSCRAYDAAGSFDPDGTIASYEWDFGDGTVATGQKVTHTYSNLGHLNQPTLIVTDNDGAQAYTDLPDVVVHYGFAGFFTPIVDSKATVHAGATLPVKWQLTQPDGSAQNSLSAVSSYTASKSGATFSLANDGTQYNLHVKTPKVGRTAPSRSPSRSTTRAFTPWPSRRSDDDDQRAHAASSSRRPFGRSDGRCLPTALRVRVQ